MNTPAFRLGFLVAVLLLLSACVNNVNGQPEPRTAPDENIESGRKLLASYGCLSVLSAPGF